MTEPVVESRPVTHTMPTDGVPEVAVDALAVASIVEQLQAGTGPIAIDAERASGYRYSQRAYLIQFARSGAGVALLDPITDASLDHLTGFVNALPWVLHAATQDLVCLREVGFVPTSVFDTELAGRLLGRPRVGLGALLEQELDVVLAKEHSAVDWSQRPLPEEWLAYAALDVEFLPELHDRMQHALDAAGRAHWYEEERALLLTFTGPAPREDPWRRVSGIHAIRDARRLAVVRALWVARDERARELDVSPGRVLHDSVIIDIAKHDPASPKALAAMRPVHSRNARKDPDFWFAAIEEARALLDSDLPRRAASEGSLPPPRAWAQRNPDAAARWELVRPAVVARAEELGIGPEVLIAPEAVRQLCWNGVAADAAAIAEALRAQGARQWQVTELAPAILAALAA